MIPPAAHIRSSRFPNLDKRALCSPSVAPPSALENFLIGNIFGWLRLSEIYPLRNIFTQKLSERKKANYGKLGISMLYIFMRKSLVLNNFRRIEPPARMYATVLVGYNGNIL